MGELEKTLQCVEENCKCSDKCKSCTCDCDAILNPESDMSKLYIDKIIHNDLRITTSTPNILSHRNF